MESLHTRVGTATVIGHAGGSLKGRLGGADCMRVRRILLPALPLAAGIALFGATGQPADGRMTLPHDVAQAVRVAPGTATGVAAPRQRPAVGSLVIGRGGGRRGGTHRASIVIGH